MAQQAHRAGDAEQDYLRSERVAKTKSELWHGRIYAMAGASPRHDGLTARLMRHLGNGLSAGGCEPFGSDQRVHIPSVLAIGARARCATGRRCQGACGR